MRPTLRGAGVAALVAASLLDGALPARAEPDPQDDLVEAVALLMARDAVRVPAEDVAENLRALCASGQRLACALQPVDGNDHEAVRALASPGCDDEHPDPVACLAVAWSMLPAVETGLDPAGASDPARYRALVTGACDAGLRRGCVELGTADWLGVDGYRSLGNARASWQPACEAGDGLACALLGEASHDRVWLDAGTELGSPVAWAKLADRDKRGAREAHQRACEGGYTPSCVALATEATTPVLVEGRLTPAPDRPGGRAALADACAVGDPDACARGALIDAEDGTASVEAAIAVLDRECPRLDSACEEAAFLRQGAPPISAYRGVAVSGRELDVYLFDSRGALYGCQLGLLARDPHAEGAVHVVVRVNEAGGADGVYPIDPFDAELGQCLIGALSQAHFRAPSGLAAARLPIVLSLYHGAEIEPYSGVGIDGGEEVARLRKDLPAWREPLDRCFLDHDVPEADVRMRVRFSTFADGSFRDVSVVTSSETPEVDQCVTAWIAARKAVVPVRFQTPIEAEIRFLQPATEPLAVAPPAPVIAADTEPVRVRVRVITLARSIVNSATARTNRKARASIEATARAFADHVASATAGRVAIDLGFAYVDDGVRSVSRVDDADGAWRLTADLPETVADAIQPGAWDATFVFAPLPRTAPQPPIDHSWPTHTLRGTTVSLLFVRGNAEVPANVGVPAFERLLHAWWYQVDTRARRSLDLGVDWLPARDTPLDADGHVLDPRAWGEKPSHTALQWYDHVLAEIPPAFWRDVWAIGERLPPSPANLAPAARVIGEGIVDVDGMTDGVLDLPGFQTVTRADLDTTEPWFGLEWREAVQVGRVVAHVGNLDQPDVPSFVRPALEAQPADSRDGAWVAVPGAALATDGAVYTWTLPVLGVQRLRLRITDAALGPVVRELEVYAR